MIEYRYKPIGPILLITLIIYLFKKIISQYIVILKKFNTIYRYELER